jgi:hypothetical protein
MVIHKITVDVVTGGDDDAGTDGDVYLGMAGREFWMNVENQDDFEAGDHACYIFGEDSNVAHADRNDPRKDRPVHDADVDRFPVYVRMVPHGRHDDWELAEVRVSVYSEAGVRHYGALLEPGQKLWLGRTSGLYCYLDRLA